MFSEFSDRYVRAKYQTQRGGGDWVFRLADEIGGSTRVIVPAAQISEFDDPYKHKHLFLVRQTADSKNWIASLWDKSRNPWITGRTPSIGAFVEGYIVNFNKQGTVGYVDFVYSDCILNGVIYPNHLPDFVETYTASSCLEIGDKVAASIHDVDRDTLQFTFDFSSWYKSIQKSWRADATSAHNAARRSVYLTSSVTPQSKTEPECIGGRMLVIDDDPSLCDDVAAFFSRHGICVDISTSTSAKGIQESVYTNIRSNPDFIISDFQISKDIKITNEVRGTIEAYGERNPAAKIAMISGNSNEAEKYATENNFDFFPKPSALWKIAEWCKAPNTPTPRNQSHKTLRSVHNFFAVEGQHKKIIEDATILLEKISKIYNFWGAVWMLRNPAGSYEVRASTNDVQEFLDDRLVAQLRHSIIEERIHSEKAEQFLIPSSDPLAKALPKDVRYGFALPISTETRFPRCIVFLSSERIGSAAIEYINDRVDHFALLIRGIAQSEVIDEVAASAQQGRIAFATLHEVRTEIQKISNAANSDKPINARMQRILDHLSEAEKLTAGELTRFKPNDIERDALGDLIKRVVDKMQVYFDDKSRSHGPRILIEIDPAGAGLTIPNSVMLERTLVNLIDNASDFLKKVTTRFIWVRMVYVASDDKFPIRISVSDTGPGISFGDLETVFLPRRSGRTELSTGLGLYISRELIEMLGGTISARHRPRWAGAEFEIKLPHLVG